MEGGGINQLANVLHDRILRTLHDNDQPLLDFGTIERNGYLTTDTLKIPMQKSEYYVLKGIGSLEKGDRVLVAWVYPQPVVVGVLTKNQEV